jgi:ABC-type enterobactin transport system permease subunit
MALAVVAMVLLFTAGVTPLSLAAVVLASLLTSLSVMLFGSRRSERRDRL